MPRPTAKADPNRQLMIKVKTSQRLGKESLYYVKETEENERKLAKMIEDGKDPYDIKKFKEVLGESQMMIPDSQNRHKKSLDELKEFMSLHEEELEDNEWLMSAKTLVEEAA